MQSSYINENLEYEDQMLEGTITPITKEISLCAGAVYDFTVNDKSGNDYTIRNINVTSSSPYVFMRQIIGASGELCCRQVDGQSGNVEFCVGKTDIKLNVKINLVNNSTSSLDQITLGDVKADEVLSFVANPVSELSKHYDYQVNIQSTGYSNVDLMFCTDFYNWTEEAENAFLDNDYYTISTNPNPSWLTRSVLSYVFSDDLKYNIEVDGVLKTISITPLSDTVFTSQNHGVKNLHTYIYVRYATDSANTYRWRWRIMIGGELEGIDMYTHSSAGDKIIDNNLIEIHEGDEVSWIFRCMYRPSVTSNHRTLWYLSESDEMRNYVLDNGAHVTLPVPAQSDSAANKALYFFGGKNEKCSFGNEECSKLTVYYYLLDEETENGISDLWTNYGTSGSDCKLVVVNLDTGLFNSVDIKNYTQNTIIIRGNALREGELSPLVNIPEEVNTLKSLNKAETVVLLTSYNGTSCNQEFPFTERGDGYRTFFLPHNGRLRITFESNFDMDTISVTQNEHATESFVMGSVFIEENKRNASIVFSTDYYEKNRINERIDESTKIQSLTDNGIYIFKINDNLIYIRVISYDNDKV